MGQKVLCTCINAMGSSLQCHCSSIDNLSVKYLGLFQLDMLTGKRHGVHNFGNGIMKTPGYVFSKESICVCPSLTALWTFTDGCVITMPVTIFTNPSEEC